MKSRHGEVHSNKWTRPRHLSCTSPLLCSLSIPMRSVRTHREEQPSLRFFTCRTNKEARKLPTADKAVENTRKAAYSYSHGRTRKSQVRFFTRPLQPTTMHSDFPHYLIPIHSPSPHMPCPPLQTLAVTLTLTTNITLGKKENKNHRDTTERP